MSDITLVELALEEAEIKYTQDIIEDLQDSSSATQGDLETLQDINTVLKDKQDTIDPPAQKIAQIATETLCRRLGMPVPKSISTENYSGFSTQSQIRVAIEENEGMIARIIAALKAVMRKIVEFFKKLFTKIKEFIKKILQLDKYNEKYVKETAQKNVEIINDAKRINATGEIKEKTEKILKIADQGREISVTRSLLTPFIHNNADYKTFQKDKIPVEDVIEMMIYSMKSRENFMDHFNSSIDHFIKRRLINETSDDESLTLAKKDVIELVRNAFQAKQEQNTFHKNLTLEIKLFSDDKYLALDFHDDFRGIFFRRSNTFRKREKESFIKDDEVTLLMDYSQNEATKMIEFLKVRANFINGFDRAISKQDSIIEYLKKYIEDIKPGTDSFNNDFHSYWLFVRSFLLLYSSIVNTSVAVDRNIIFNSNHVFDIIMRFNLDKV